MRILLSLLIGTVTINAIHAGVILSGPDVSGAAGFGNMPRILTVQATGNASTESGCIAWNGSRMIVGSGACSNAANVGGDEPNPHGFPKDSVPTLSSLGFTKASDIGIVFDATEPGNTSGNSLTMSSLILKFYSPSGVLLLSESLDNAPLVFNQTVVGNGKTDYLFVLDQQGINEVTNTIFANPNSGNVHIALETTMTGVHGGPESFLAEAAVGHTATVPEPASAVLISAGLIGLAVLRRLTKRNFKHRC